MKEVRDDIVIVVVLKSLSLGIIGRALVLAGKSREASVAYSAGSTKAQMLNLRVPVCSMQSASFLARIARNNKPV